MSVDILFKEIVLQKRLSYQRTTPNGLLRNRCKNNHSNIAKKEFIYLYTYTLFL